METFTVQAVYKKGVLRPKTKLNLPEDSVVDVQVKLGKTRAGFGSLLGIWSHLSDAEVEDLEKSLVKA
jgi:predicted DNA-binding antitoxin AbrB/MazE fold protein